MKNRINYSLIAESYDKLHKEEQIKKLKLIEKNIKIIEPLLDVGCGTGISTNYFKVKSFGIDNNKEMIEIGKKNGYKNLIFSDAEDLPFKNKSFNTIISVTSFHNFNNMEKALKEIIRVSRNKNIAISFLKKSSKLNEFKLLIRKYFERLREIEEDKDIIFVIR